MYVGADGKYYDAVSGGSETTYVDGDLLGFQTGVTTWNVSSNFTVFDGLDYSTTSGITANIASGATLTFATTMFPTASSSSNITFSGAGSLAVSAFVPATYSAIHPTITIDMDLTVSTSYSSYSAINLIVTEGHTYKNARFSGGVYLELESNAKYYATGSTLNIQGSGAGLLTASGSYLNTIINMRMTNGNVSGKVVVQGGRTVTSDYGGDTYSMELTGVNTFNASAEVQQLKADTYQRTTFYGTVNSYAGTSKLAFANVVQLANATLNLHTTDAIISGCGQFTEDNVPVGSSQSNSTFILNGTPTSSSGGKSTVTMNLFADQNFGEFQFMLDSVLKLAFNESVLNVGDFVTVDSTTINLFLNGLGEQNFFINNMTESEIDDLKLYNADGTTLLVKDVDYYVVAGTYNSADGYWISTVVPEPAEWAALFGALALGLAIYRKRNK
ncbi:MAG: hypothetical protein PHH26_02880 [Candidatus Thermoplasmatota archaeon]|nr:hypothetical protein [Candidatus Thermoplasmatota archaeon]